MISRFFSAQTKTITGAAIVLGAASLVSRIIGIVRDRLFVHFFGTGDLLDSYYAAFRIPDTLYHLVIIGALSAGFIPIFTKLLKSDMAEAWRVTNSMINILAIAMIIFSSIGMLFAPQLMHYIVPGFSGTKFELTVLLTRIMLLSPIIHGVSTVVGGVIQSFKHFFVYALAPIVYNLAIIFGALVLVPMFGPVGLACGVVLGALFHLLVQLPTMIARGYRYEWRCDIRNLSIRQIGTLMIPRTLSLGVHQLNWIILIMFASALGSGSVSAFTLADNLQYAPVSIIGVSFAMAAFPILAGYAAEKRFSEITSHVTSTIKQILVFTIPILIVFIALRAQVVRVIYGTGAFDWQATVLTMNTLALFAVSLPAQCVLPLLARTSFALEDTKTPFWAGIVGIVVNVIAAVYFKSFLGLPGLALAFSLAITVQVALLWLSLRLKIGSFDGGILRALAILTVSGLLMALTIQLLKEPLASLVDMTRFWGILSQGLISGIVGILVYILSAWVFRLEEIRIIAASFKRRFLRVRGDEARVEF